MATYAIGDLQGCLETFERLLERIAFDPRVDRLWLTGDLVNRGPDSLGTLRRIIALGERATSVLGNHDLHLLAVALTASARPRRGDTLDDILHARDRESLIDWLRRQPLFHHDPALGFSMVHAGIPRDWTLDEAAACAAEVQKVLAGPQPAELLGALYGNTPDRWQPTLRGIERLRFIVNACTRMRYCHRDGQLDLGHKGPPEDAPPELVPWFAVTGRRSAGQPIVFGHWSTLRLSCEEESRHAVHPIDTGAVWGGMLTALRLEDAARFSVRGVAPVRRP